VIRFRASNITFVRRKKQRTLPGDLEIDKMLSKTKHLSEKKAYIEKALEMFPSPGSIYGLTLFYVHVYFAVCAILDLWYKAFFETLVKIYRRQRKHLSSQVVMPRKGRCSIVV
jgi:hypothetical protein